MFRYSDKPIFGVLETNPVFEALNPNKSTGDRDEFARLQIELLNGFRKRAAAGGSKRKYVQGSGPGPNSSTFFGAVMCTPDLSENDCNDCLIFGFANATKGRTGLRWFCPSCSFQIQTNLRFFLHEYEYESDPPSDQEPGKHRLTLFCININKKQKQKLKQSAYKNYLTFFDLQLFFCLWRVS